jgi:hypothetical protein
MRKKAVRLRIAAVLVTALLGMLGAVTPAWATTFSAAQAGSHSAIARADVISVRPAISEQACTSGRATWVHIEMAAGTGLTVKCFGGKGTQYFSANTSYYVCAGNNYGQLHYYDPHQGKYETWDFGPGHQIAWTYGVDISWLIISSWSGGDSC